MTRRIIVGVLLALVAAVAIPLGLPKVISAAPLTVSYTALNVKPLPIEQPGQLNPTGTNTATMCVQPLNGTHTVAVGTMVDLSIDVGLFNTIHPGVGGSAEVTSTSTALTATPTAFATVASCTYQNQEVGPVTLMDAIPITYTGPTTAQTTGRDLVAATSDGTSFDANTGTCTGSGVCNTGTYVFSPVTQYKIDGSTSPTTIAVTGTLAAGANVQVTVIAEDASGAAVPGAYLDLSLASAGGSATAFNPISGTTKNLSNSPNRFGADSSGSVVVSYTTANPLPSTGTDTITAQNHPTPTHQNSTSYTYGATSTFTQAPYTAVTPFRICDTRPVQPGIAANQCDTGAGSGPIGGFTDRVITVDVTGSGVPGSGVTAAVVNVTAIAPSAATFLTLYPDGQGRPATSNLNVRPHQVVANLVEVGVSAAGKLDIFNDAGTTNVAIDVEGYVSSASTGLYTPLAPSRICDTRAAGGGIASNQCDASGANPILASGPVLTFNVHTATDGVPATGVTAVVFNLTAIAPSAPTVLTAYAAGAARPTASNVNVNPGEAVPNRVIVPVSGSETVSIWNSVGSVNVAVDVDGYFSASGAQFTALSSPARVCNTQFGNTSDAGCTEGLVPAGGTLNIDVTGIDGIPVLGAAHSPVAIVANVTAVNASATTFVTVYPGLTSRPTASDLNVTSFWPVPNLVVVEVGSDGTINLFNEAGNVNLIVDVLGYYS